MEKKKNITFQEIKQDTVAKDFVPRAAGLSKGSEGDDVIRLQNYLSEFGYFENEVHTEFFGAGLKTAIPPSPSKKGSFDLNTEMALKKFQELNGLPVSGQLDEATLELMSRPRCGFPDTAAFVVHGNKWATHALTYGFQNFSTDLTQNQVRSAIAQALGIWSAVTPLTFTEIPFANNPDIKIRFVTGDHGDGNGFDGSGGVLAHAFFPPPNGGDLAGDAHFDEDEIWSVNLPPSGVDLVTVAAHEFGHALGLAHSTITGALMYAFYDGAHRNLEDDDIAGIQSIYGKKSGGWISESGVIISNISAGRNTDGSLELFARGADNAVWHNRQTTPNGPFAGWASLGGVFTSNVAVGQNADGRLELFVRGTDNGVWHNRQTAPGGTFPGWASRGGVITSDISVGRNADGRLVIFARGTDNGVYHQLQTAPNSPFTDWAPRGGVINGNIAVGQNADGSLELFVRGTDNAVWHQRQTVPNGPFSGWASLGGTITGEISVGRNADGRLELFARGTGNTVSHNRQTAPNGSFSGWSSLNGVISGDVSVGQNADGRLELFVRGTDNTVWYQQQTAPSGTFPGWSTLSGIIISDIAVGQNADGRLELFARGAGNTLLHRSQTAPNNGWGVN